MKCLLTSFGSAGDFLPTLSVGAALRSSGHDVTLVANPYYASAAQRIGAAFIPAGAHVDVFTLLESNPSYLDTLRGPEQLWNDFAVPNTTATYHAVREALATERADVIINSNVSAGGLWAAAEAGIPSVMISATPLSWMHAGAPMMLTDGALPEWSLPWLNDATRASLTWYLDRKLRPLAKKLGVAVADPTLSAAEKSVDLHLGLWSPVVRGPAPGDPSNGAICGFGRAGHLGGNGSELDPELEAFLSTGPPPVVIALGSIYCVTGGDVIGALALACNDLGLRCLIVGHPAAPMELPAGTLIVKYAPYHRVFPRAAAVVIHGGAGTTAEALRAGRPVIALPFAFDQFAMAWQIQRLGVGVKVTKKSRSRGALAWAIDFAVSDTIVQAKAKQIAHALAVEPDGATVAAAMVERLLGPRAREN